MVRRLDRAHSGGIVLPAAYVAEHVDLGYAVTAYRAQGVTVDTAHVVVSLGTTRENLYVAMTRGREDNHAYVITSASDENHGEPNNSADGEEVTARSVLVGVLAHRGAELSAHQTITAEQDTLGSIAQLAAEYDTIAVAAQRPRWANLLSAGGVPVDRVDDILASDAFGPLATELRRAEADGHDIDRVLSAAVARHCLDDADDIAAVLHHRIQLATTHRPARRAPRARPIAGLIPAAVGPMASEMRQSLEERRDLIEQRATTLAEPAIHDREPWVKQLGDPPTLERDDWMRGVRTIAAYRDRHAITSRHPLGPEPATDAQRLDRARAVLALRRARATADSNTRYRAASGHQGIGI